MNPNIAKLASLVSEKSRSAILLALMDGLAHPASELAMMAKVKPQTASFHLATLLENGLLQVERHGRHRYYRLVRTDAAEWLESLLAVAPAPDIRSLRQADQMRHLRAARTCYDHLAGQLGVAVTDALLAQGWIREQEQTYEITPTGERFFAALSMDLDSLRLKRRAFSRKCLDWSERKPHLAGALGDAIRQHLLDNGSIEQVPGLRAIRLTDEGKAYLADTFQVSF